MSLVTGLWKQGCVPVLGLHWHVYTGDLYPRNCGGKRSHCTSSGAWEHRSSIKKLKNQNLSVKIKPTWTGSPLLVPCQGSQQCQWELSLPASEDSCMCHLLPSLPLHPWDQTQTTTELYHWYLLPILLIFPSERMDWASRGWQNSRSPLPFTLTPSKQPLTNQSPVFQAE